MIKRSGFVNSALLFFPITFIALISYLILSNFSVSDIKAASTNNQLKGYAWSSNIGWVSLSCLNESACSVSDYQVEVEPFLGGKFSGYAWSSNIGWIRFDPPGPYPEAPNYYAQVASVKAPNGKTQVQGWVRACSVMKNQLTCSGEPDSYPANNNGGWDGWIKMSGGTNNCPNYHATPAETGPYETCLTADYKTLDGWAWGGDVVGWIEFNPSYNNVVVPTSSTRFKETRPR